LERWEEYMAKTCEEIMINIDTVKCSRHRYAACKPWDAYDLIMKHYDCTDETAKQVVKMIKGITI